MDEKNFIRNDSLSGYVVKKIEVEKDEEGKEIIKFIYSDTTKLKKGKAK